MKKNYSKNNRIVFVDLVCMMLAMLGMYMILVMSGYAANGGLSIINGDMKENYIPAIRNLCRSIKNGDGILYSWMYGMGSNISLYNAYYAYSPLNVLYFIFYDFDMNLVTAAIIIFKVGLAALCFRLYIRNVFGLDGVENIAVSLLYALCSFQVVYNVQNIIWLDALFILPIIFWGIDRLVKKGSVWILLGGYVYIFISQFYMGYMIGFASILYFALNLYVHSEDTDYKRSVLIGKYSLSVVIAIMISAVFWLPALLFLLEHFNAGGSEFQALGINLFDVYNQLFWGEISGYNAVFPYIYCGVPALILVPMFFIDKSNDKKERTGYAVILLFLILSCIVTPFYAFWHAFDFPNSYGFRFSYIISFILCVLMVRQMGKKNVGLVTPAIVVLLDISIYWGEMFWQKERFEAAFLSNSRAYLWINILLIAVWYGIICLREKNTAITRILICIIVAVSLTECVSNGVVAMKNRDMKGLQLSAKAYDMWDSNEKQAVRELENDNGFYRVNQYQSLGPSAGMYYGYNTLSFFGSSENIKLRNVLGYLGIWNSPRVVYNYGLTDPTKMMLGIKYDLYTDGGISGQNTESRMLVSIDNFLGLGYMVSGKPEDYYLVSTNAFENINHILSVMTGENTEVFSSVDTNCISEEESGISISDKNGMKIIECADNVNDVQEQYYSFHIATDADNCYAYVDNQTSFYNGNSYLLSGGDENYIDTNGAMSVSYIKKLDCDEEGFVLKIVPHGYTGPEEFRDIYFCSLNKQRMERAFELLKKNVLDVIEYKNGYIKGKICVDNEKQLLFTSIPYEKGWKAFVDGEEIKISPVMYDSFIAFNVTQGEHIIELNYCVPGKTAGIGLTLVGCLIAAGVVVLDRKRISFGKEDNDK